MQIPTKTFIREIFTSIQGEGLYIGEKHLFIRFCKCNLNCKFCDTDFDIKNAKEYDLDELLAIIKDNKANIISLTGGEPLLETAFLKEFLPLVNKKIYLETNGTLVKELAEIIDLVDVIAMDIKLKSATGEKNRFLDNEEFLKTALQNKKEVFIKVVFDKNITPDEITSVSKIAEKYGVTIVLQPKMPLEKDLDIIEIFNLFYKEYQNIRLIPQTHKFLHLD